MSLLPKVSLRRRYLGKVPNIVLTQRQGPVNGFAEGRGLEQLERHILSFRTHNPQFKSSIRGPRRHRMVTATPLPDTVL